MKQIKYCDDMQGKTIKRVLERNNVVFLEFTDKSFVVLEA